MIMKPTIFTKLFALMAGLMMLAEVQAQTLEAYVVKSTDGKTLTFYYDTKKSSREGTVYGINDT